MREIEFEKRQMLSLEQYNLLVSFFSNAGFRNKITEQTNIYFDNSNNRVFEDGNCLRIRQYEDNKPSKFTIKLKGINGQGDIEVFQELSKEDEMLLLEKGLMPLGPVKECLVSNNYEADKVLFMGKIHTSRQEFFLEDHIIVLDKNKFLDVIDYNIEVESNSMENAEKYLKEICSKFSIEYIGKCESKSQRTTKRYLEEKTK